MRLLSILLVLLLACAGFSQKEATVGSKKFTESYVLGEIAKKALENAGFVVEHKQGMGATSIVWGALSGGSIDAYAEYTGTLAEEILKKPGIGLEEIRSELDKQGIGVTGELGFNNTYALVMRKDKAAALGIRKISDLATHTDLKAGPTHEFLDREDGWKKVMASYGIKLADVKGIEHGLGYSALNSGSIDIKDCYSTDAEIAKYNLLVLEDDKKFFPSYMAVFVYRKSLAPEAVKALESIVGTIDESFMSRLNAFADEKDEYSGAAAMYFTETSGKKVEIKEDPLMKKIAGWTLQHLYLVGLSLSFAVLIGIPLGIVASRPGSLSHFILGVTGVIQTIPSLALLALLVPIPFFGISDKTAIVALFLYSLLPIVRNTAIGLSTIATPLRESAEALGLEPATSLKKVYLPLALPTILAGVKTSAVICVGTATLAALIGAGGLGEPIISGLSLNDNATVLQGAIPAAVLAVIVQFVFDRIEHAVVPRGLRKR
jgi:osmoprotectant transport system permease protein